jgi:hypothetical protein
MIATIIWTFGVLTAIGYAMQGEWLLAILAFIIGSTVAGLFAPRGYSA